MNTWKDLGFRGSLEMKWKVGQIKRIVVNNIGGHEFIDIKLKPGINLITGGNGSGKSSLVSAIALLCGWSGRRAGKDSNLSKYIKIGANKGIVRIHFANDNDESHPGYFPDIYGDEIIIERILYMKGNTTYNFRGSKTTSPIHKFQDAKTQLSQFRAYSNIIINNPITFLTQMDAKYLIREQGSPKTLYEFFQRAHLFDASWKHLADEQLHIEKAELLSKSLESDITSLENGLMEYKKLKEIIDEYNIANTRDKTLEKLIIFITIKKLNSSIKSLQSKRSEIEKTMAKLDTERLKLRITEIENDIENIQSDLKPLQVDYENNIDNHNKAKIEFDKIQNNINFYNRQIVEINIEISRTEEEIRSKEKNNLLREKQILDFTKDFSEEIDSYGSKISQLIKRRDDLLVLKMRNKNEIMVFNEKISQKENECIFLSNEKKFYDSKFLNISNQLDNDKNSLELMNIKLLNIDGGSSNNNTETCDVSNFILNDYSTNQVVFQKKYLHFYENYTDKEFETVFGYSKRTHNIVINQFESKEGSQNVLGPLALYLYTTEAAKDERTLNIIDEIIGGRLERYEPLIGYKIRRNYKYWLVNSSEQKKKLIFLFKKNGIILDPTLIFIRSSFGQKRYDLSHIRKRYPKRGSVITDLLYTEKDEVFNFLVDNSQIETTFIFLNEHEMELIYDYNYNIRRAHCLANSSFKYRRGGIVVSPEFSDLGPKKYSKVLIRNIDHLKSKLSSRNTDGELPNAIICINQQKNQLLNNISINQEAIKEVNDKLKELMEKSDRINMIIKAYMEKIISLNDQTSKFELELDEIDREEHRINLKIEELKIKRKKFELEDHCDYRNTPYETPSLNDRITDKNRLINEFENKLIGEKALQTKIEEKIEELKQKMEYNKELINLKEENIMILKTKKNSLQNEIPKFEEEGRNLSITINQIDSMIVSKKDEFSKLKIKYLEIGDTFNEKKDENSLEAIALTNEMQNTLKYFNYQSVDLNESNLPDITVVNSWKSEILKKKDLLYLDILKYSRIIGLSGLDDSKAFENITQRINKVYEEKKIAFERKLKEFEEENQLLAKNKKNLDNRVSQLQESHIRCGKDVNSHFKYYFSLFWSNTMRPHLIFDHEKSTLNIRVIPDTAVIRKPIRIERNPNIHKEDQILEKGRNRDFVNREIQSLSGGESSSIGISLLLALSQNNSSPFHLFDEPDVYMDDSRRMIMIQSLIEFQFICSNNKQCCDRQILFVTPHNEIVPHIQENYTNFINIIQLIKR
ncbi:Smc ABC ATPase [Cryptosporidium felis]|nr:Smc ABC ATPase [Cryptosporidium felis]